MNAEGPLSELFADIEVPVRLYQWAEMTYHRIIQTYPDLISTDLNVIFYREIVESLHEELKPYAFDLCLFIVELLKDHPELIDGAEDDEDDPE